MGYSNCGLEKGLATDVEEKLNDFKNSLATEMLLVNSVETEWNVPVAIPNDATTATITCSTEATKTNDVAKDPLRIYQSSMMA